MRLISPTILATTVLISSNALANAETKVIASIKPVHSLVSAVMEGVGSPGLLVKGPVLHILIRLSPLKRKNFRQQMLFFGWAMTSKLSLRTR